MDKRVFLLRVDEYEQNTLNEAVSFLCQNLASDLRDKAVLLKPNMVVAVPPERAVCTHPEVVRAFIRCLSESRVMVGDSPALGSTYKAAEASGILSVCLEEGVELIDFCASGISEERKGPLGRGFPFASAVKEANAVINLAKLKTHALMRYTGAVKNIFGCLPGKVKAEMHVRFQEIDRFADMLVDVYTAVAPVLSVVDGIVAMEGNGPRNGVPRRVGLLIAGRDAVAVDAVACEVVGIDPFSVPTIRAAHRRGIGCGELQQIEVVGEEIAAVRVKNFHAIDSAPSALKNLPPILGRLLRKQLTAQPEVCHDSCTHCAVCLEACPVNAITLEEKVTIYEPECIRCYCCQEVCPSGAVVLRKKGLGRFFT